MRIETRARARVLQALYAWDVSGSTNLQRSAELIWDDLAIGPAQRAFAEPLIRILMTQQASIDAQLADVTTNWRLERIGTIERCVLRMAAAELTLGSAPPLVVIQESVTLAERFGSPASAKFVNGVLDALARRMALI